MRRFRSLLVIVCSLVCSLLLTGCGSSLPDALKPGAKVPFSRVTYLDGGYDSLATYRGKKVAVLFWAKWCSKSRGALSKFEQIAEEDSGSTEFLAVSLDKFQEEDELRRYISAQEIDDVRHVFSGNGPDDEAVMAFRAFEIPIVFVVDESGTVVHSTFDIGEIRDFI